MHISKKSLLRPTLNFSQSQQEIVRDLVNIVFFGDPSHLPIPLDQLVLS